MRVVLDTNVLVSAALKSTSLPAMTLLTVARVGVLLKSHATEAQLWGVLARPYLAALISPASVHRIREALATAERVDITESLAACRDPTDDKFLELAVSGAADVIVSGDADLLVLHPFRGIPVLPPAGFLRLVRSCRVVMVSTWLE